MSDEARFASMIWPDSNYHFRRRWAEPPPQSERSRGTAPTIPAADFASNVTTSADTFPDRILQRASAWDRAADNELALGHHSTAERFSKLAADLRDRVQ